MARRRQPGRLNVLTVKKIGDWNGAIRFCSSMGYEVRKKAEKAQWDICKKLKQIVIAHLLAQDLNWEPLSRKTRQNKKENKNLILIDTEIYLDNIKVWKESGAARVGVKKGVLYKRGDNTISLERVAILNEFGTSRVPARPLWNPSIEELGGEEGIRDFVASAIYRRLKWLSRGTPIKVTLKQILKKVE